jgi:hypothetical protein
VGFGHRKGKAKARQVTFSGTFLGKNRAFPGEKKPEKPLLFVV